jgi:MFS family permease
MRATVVLGFDTLAVSWGSSVYSAAVESVSVQFGVSSTVALLGLTLYICGFATGPLAFGLMSELYGRKITNYGSNFCLHLFHVCCCDCQGFSNTHALSILRWSLCFVWVNYFSHVMSLSDIFRFCFFPYDC